MKVFWAFLKSASLVAFGVTLLVLAQRVSGWRLLSNDPGAISSFLSSLAQFATVPVTLALGIVVLVIQLQAGSLTSRAGALAVSSPQFLFTVTLLLEAPAYCIALLGIFDFSQEQVTMFARELALGAVVPVLLTFVFLARFTNTWFRLVSPAAFTGHVLGQAVQGLREKNRDTVALALRGLGEALANLAISADYQSLGICAKQLGTLLEEYVSNFKRSMPDKFFYYDFPQRHRSSAWVENEACDTVRDAVDVLMARGAPAYTWEYLVERLVPFGEGAIEAEDMEALQVLSRVFIEMGTTEKMSEGRISFNLRPLNESTNLVAYALPRNEEATTMLAALFFFLFTYINNRAEQMSFFSAEYDYSAKKLKELDVGFAEAAHASRQMFGQYWDMRFPDADLEQEEVLRRIEGL